MAVTPTFALPGALPKVSLPAPPGLASLRAKTITFKKDGTFFVPAGVSYIKNLSGIGLPGTPGSGAPDYHYGYRTFRTLHYIQDGGPEQTTAEVDQGWTETGSTTTPTNYCSSHAFDGPDLEYWYCYRYVLEIHDEGNYVPPTTGASASAFGKTFPGGAGGPAVITRYSNIRVISRASYPITVPVGGFVTIIYG